jgi:diazepam-binding inhibitor (GABA receptor modulating acyl-CoA-binding protein)
MSLDDDFNNACEKVKKLTKKPTDSILLQLYGLYKQSTNGRNKEPNPSIFDLKAYSKWNAWDECRILSKNMAKQRYIDLVYEITGGTSIT